MPRHEYTPEQAFELLIRKLQERSPELADHVRAVVNAGKDIQEEETRRRGRRRHPRLYRRTVPYRYDEALTVALNALRAYFVEEPLFGNSANENFALAAVEADVGLGILHGASDSASLPVDPETKGQPKVIEIELRTETQIAQANEDTFALKRILPAMIARQREQVDTLAGLLDFRED